MEKLKLHAYIKYKSLFEIVMCYTIHCFNYLKLKIQNHGKKLRHVTMEMCLPRKCHNTQYEVMADLHTDGQNAG